MKAFVIVLRLAAFVESLVTGVSILRNSQHLTAHSSLGFKVVEFHTTGGGGDYEKSCVLSILRQSFKTAQVCATGRLSNSYQKPWCNQRMEYFISTLCVIFDCVDCVENKNPAYLSRKDKQNKLDLKSKFSLGRNCKIPEHLLIPVFPLGNREVIRGPASSS